MSSTHFAQPASLHQNACGIMLGQEVTPSSSRAGHNNALNTVCPLVLLTLSAARCRSQSGVVPSHSYLAMVGMAGYGRYNADKSPVNKSDMAHLGRTGEYVSLLGVQCYVASRQMNRRFSPDTRCTAPPDRPSMLNCPSRRGI